MNSFKKEINKREDIQLLIDSFYGKVRKDASLGPIFNNTIQDRWPQHLDTMYRFWETVLLDKRNYRGNPFMPHANLPIEKKHFNRWLHLFYETLAEHFKGKIAKEAQWRAEKMAEMFQLKLQYYSDNSKSPII